LIYAILKPLIRIALFFFCRKIIIQHQSVLNTEGPLLVTANHPNSFLDAIIIGAFFKHPVHFLARGDAFKQPYHRFLLGLLNMIPIYRLSEGKQYLHLNEYAFKASQHILNNNGIVLIFIEGICVRSHELQPLKKGAARIALDYQGKQPLRVLPLGIAYSHLDGWSKSVQLIPSTPMLATDLFVHQDRAKNMLRFNQTIQPVLERLIVLPTQPAHLNSSTAIKIYQTVGLIGWLLHYPLIKPIQIWVNAKTRNTVFYDSILFGSYFFLYPVFCCLLALVLHALLGGFIVWIILILFILTGRCIIYYKNPIE
jgi:1-acyl-sn-glycerol-3-phosphate acyltransferase